MPQCPPVPNQADREARAPRSEAARALMGRMKRLADRCVAEAQCPVTLPARGGETGAPAARRPSPSRVPAESPAERDQALASKLADILGDAGSLRYYEQLARRSREGGLLPRRSALERRDLLLTKARQLAALKAPQGPIRNPAACFVSWVKGLG